MIFKLRREYDNIVGMKTCFDLAIISSSVPVFATWAMPPPLVPVQTLIFVSLIACILLFWVRSRAELKRQYYDRLYGPGVKTVPLEWWEADLDPIFKRSMSRLADQWIGKIRHATRR